MPSEQGKISARQVQEAVEAHRRDDSFEHMVQPGMVYISFPTEVGTLYSRRELEELYHTCLQEAVEAHRRDDSFEHMVQPGMVYISFPTEVGTLYSRRELEELYHTCRQYSLPLFIDGARLGYGLCSPENDVTLADVAHLCDMFYIGGTKVGALCDMFYIGGTKVGALFGEALVITTPRWQTDFRYSLKQHGGMLAKGRLLGLQFETLFTDDLYFNISRNAIRQALRIREAIRQAGYAFFMESSTNQQFPIFPDEVLKRLSQDFLPRWQTDFRYSLKQHGGMLAKGRLLGLQFETLFTDDLYFNISRNAIRQALRIREAIRQAGYAFFMESSTNQQFPIFPDEVLKRLSQDFLFTFWQKTDEHHTAVRICTSWATTEENTDRLIAALQITK